MAASTLIRHLVLVRLTCVAPLIDRKAARSRKSQLRAETTRIILGNSNCPHADKMSAVEAPVNEKFCEFVARLQTRPK